MPADQPFVLVDAQDRGLVVTAANRHALAAGIGPGLGLADARALLPSLAARPAERAADERALTALSLWCERYGSPSGKEAPACGPLAGANAASDALFIDISGVAHLFDGEPGLAEAITRRLSGFGLTARIGIAGTPGAASAAARFGPPRTGGGIIPSDAPATALAPYPVAALRLDDGTIRLLHRLGLKTIGDLEHLPRAALRRRFPAAAAAEAVLLRLDQALGVRTEPLKPMRAPRRHAAVANFSEPLLTAEGVDAALKALMEQLTEALTAARLGVRQLAVVIFRADKSVARFEAGFSAASRDSVHLLRLVAEKVAALDLGFGVDRIEVRAERSEPLAITQPKLTGRRRAGTGANLPELVDRIAGRLGPERIFRLMPRESYIPERAQGLARAIADRTTDTGPSWKRPAGLPRPPFLLARPEPITATAEVPDGPPQQFRWRRALYRVARSEGPERLAPEWWRTLEGKSERPRDYYAVEDASGARYWVFREGLHGEGGGEDENAEGGTPRPPAWFMHGLYG